MHGEERELPPRQQKRTDRDQEILAMWSAGHKGAEIAEHFRISRQRVSQVVRRAGGPSVGEVREIRSAQQTEAAARVAGAIRDFLTANPGSTLAEIAMRVGLPIDVIRARLPADV